MLVFNHNYTICTSPLAIRVWKVESLNKNGTAWEIRETYTHFVLGSFKSEARAIAEMEDFYNAAAHGMPVFHFTEE